MLFKDEPQTRTAAKQSHGVNTLPGQASGQKNPTPEQQLYAQFLRETIEQQKRNGQPWKVKENGFLSQVFRSVNTRVLAPSLKKLTEQYVQRLVSAQKLRLTADGIRQKLANKSREADISANGRPGDPIEFGNLASEGEMQIGFTRLIIPPERVQVREVTASTEVPGLRTNSTNLVKTGKGRIQISLDLVFEGEKMIDSSLRELIAQFRAYPYVPVISPYLVRLIQPKISIPPDEKTRRTIVERRATALQAVAQARLDAITHLDRLIDQFPLVQALVSSNQALSDARVDFLSVVDLDRLDGVTEKLVLAYRRAVLSNGTKRPTGQRVELAVSKFVLAIEQLRFALLDLQRLTFQELQIQIGGLIDPQEGVVPCVLDTLQVSTVEERPDLLRASLTLLYFNPIPYGGVLRYRDFYGRTTVDPHEALHMRRQVNGWLTSRGAPPPLVSDLYDASATPRELSRPDARGLDVRWLGRWSGTLDTGVDAGPGGGAVLGPLITQALTRTEEGRFDRSGLIIEYASTDFQLDREKDVERKTADGVGGLKEKLSGQAPRWRKLDLRHKPGVEVVHISTGLGNRLALQPIPGEFFPSMQYMGGKPGRMSITLDVVDQNVLTEIHAMKLSNQRASTLGIRHWRRPEVHIRNRVLNLMGFWSAQIDAVTTQSVSPDTTRVILELSEHRVDEAERGVIRRPEVFSASKLIEIFEYLSALSLSAQEKARTRQVARLNGVSLLHLSPRVQSKVEQARRRIESNRAIIVAGGVFDPTTQIYLNGPASDFPDPTPHPLVPKFLRPQQPSMTDTALFNRVPPMDPAEIRASRLLFGEVDSDDFGEFDAITKGTVETLDTKKGLITTEVLRRALFLDAKSGPGLRVKQQVLAELSFPPDSKAKGEVLAARMLERLSGSVSIKAVSLDPQFGDSGVSYDEVIRGADTANVLRQANALATLTGGGGLNVRGALDALNDPRTVPFYYVFSRPQLPSPFVLRALAQFYAKSQANAQDELTFNEKDNSIQLLDQSGLDNTSHAVALLELMQHVTKDMIRPATKISLQELVLGKAGSIEQFLRQQRGRFEGVYRDLALPLYEEALSELLSAILENRRRRSADGDPPQKDTIRSLDELTQEERALIAPFVPTYEQLGQVPPVGSDGEPRSLQDFAYDLKDRVTPDFPYFGRSLTPDINQIKAAVDQRAQRGDALARRVFATDPPEKGNQGALTTVIGDPIEQLRRMNIFDAAQDQIGATGDPPDQKRVTVKAGEISEESTDVLLTQAYGPGRYRAEFKDFKGDTPEQMKSIFDAAVASEGDRSASLRRAFPTVRLFFIEEDTREGTWTAIDDVYGFNAIISVNVTRHKYQPDLAEIMLSNIEGSLEYDRFSNTSEADIKQRGQSRSERDPSPSAQESAGPTEIGTGERLLRTFPLNEGTRIMIQMGFESHEAYLDTVFTGKIAEVQMGDIVKIVAQSYLQELLYPLPESLGTERLGSIIEEVMQGPTVDHFGRRTPLWFKYADKIELDNSRWTGASTIVSQNAGVIFADPKLKNVFTAKYTNWWSKKASQLLEDSWETGGGVKTGWDVIQDAINYSPGYIAAVVPYDLEATLFVGRPEQPYFWTDGLRAEEQKFKDTKDEIALKVSQISQQILSGFTHNRQYDGNLGSPEAVVLARQRSKSQAERPQSEFPTAQDFFFWAEIAETLPYWVSVLETRFRGKFLDTHRNPTLRGFPEKLAAVFKLHEDTRAGDELERILELVGQDKISAVLRTIYDAVTRAELSRSAVGPTHVRRGVAPRYAQTRGLTDDELSQRRLFELLGEVDARGMFQEIWPGGSKRANLNTAQRTLVNATDITQIIGSRADQIQSKFAGTTIFQGGPPIAGPAQLKSLATWIATYRASIPAMLKGLREYLQSDPLLTSAIRLTPGTSKWPLSPRQKPFRAYHLITNFDDLIENQISATRGAMWNGVAISKSGKESPLTIWADDGIVKGDRILRYFREPNADNDIYNMGQSETVPEGNFSINSYLVGFSRIAQGLRPMYRGQLVCRGRPDIKPWDIVHLYDHYNYQFGPIEVERVTHHFSAETGFVTTITPHLVAIPNNQVDSWNIIKTGWLYGGAAALGVVAATAATILLAPVVLGVGAVTAVALGLGTAVAGTSIASSILKDGTGTGVWGNFIGHGRHGAARVPVKIIPLTRFGHPWTAGIRGYGRDESGNIVGMVWDSFKQNTQDVVTGIAAQTRFIVDTLKNLSDQDIARNYWNHKRNE
jgi:hypothetical protein